MKAVLTSAFTSSSSSKGTHDLAAIERELDGIRIESKDAPQDGKIIKDDGSSNSVLQTRGWGSDWGSFLINNGGTFHGNNNGAFILNSPTGSSSLKKNKDKTGGSSFLINNTGDVNGNGKGSIVVSPDGSFSTTSTSGDKDRNSDSGFRKGMKGIINNGGNFFGDGNGSVILGSPSGSFSTTSSNGNHIQFDSKGVHATVVSPDRPQSIVIRGNRVLVNGQTVCKNIRRLQSESTYQKRKDGSMWHTNLSVGQPMTEEEITKFEAEEEEMTEAAEKEKEAALEAAQEATTLAEEQARNAMEMVNSFFKNWKFF